MKTDRDISPKAFVWWTIAAIILAILMRFL